MSDAIRQSIKTAELEDEEMISLSVSKRLAILLDGPRSNLLIKAANDAERAAEEIFIEAIDAFLDKMK